MNIDLEVAIKAIAVLAGILTAIYNIKQLNPKFRANLKMDIEIFNNLQGKDFDTTELQEYIKENLKKVYGRNRLAKQNAFMSIATIIISGAFVFGEYAKDQYSWLFFISLFVLFLGITSLIDCIFVQE